MQIGIVLSRIQRFCVFLRLLFLSGLFWRRCLFNLRRVIAGGGVFILKRVLLFLFLLLLLRLLWYLNIFFPHFVPLCPIFNLLFYVIQPLNLSFNICLLIWIHYVYNNMIRFSLYVLSWSFKVIMTSVFLGMFTNVSIILM